MRRLALIIFLLLAPVSSLLAQDPAQLYNQGNQLYKEGKFEEATKAYRQAVALGIKNADLYFNLGNAELKAGHLGPAIAAYLRAQRLQPRDPDLTFNLQFARKKISAQLPPIPRGPLTRAFSFLAHLLSANEWTALICVSWWLIGTALVGLILARSALLGRGFRVLLYFSLPLFFLALPFTVVRVKQDVFTERAVMVADKVPARSGPGEENAVLFDLYEGMDVEVGQCQGGWCRVSAGGGFIGWVPAEKFERL